MRETGTGQQVTQLHDRYYDDDDEHLLSDEFTARVYVTSTLNSGPTILTANGISVKHFILNCVS